MTASVKWPRRFRTPSLQRMYETCRRAGRNIESEFYFDGMPSRTTGARNAYWNGRQGKPYRVIRGSLAAAAFKAGCDDRVDDLAAMKLRLKGSWPFDTMSPPLKVEDDGVLSDSAGQMIAQVYGDQRMDRIERAEEIARTINGQWEAS